jgi:hypothetical protein
VLVARLTGAGVARGGGGHLFSTCRDLANMQGNTKDIKAIKQQLDQLDRTGVAPAAKAKPVEIQVDRTLGDKPRAGGGGGPNNVSPYSRGRGMGGGAYQTPRRPSFEAPR